MFPSQCKRLLASARNEMSNHITEIMPPNMPQWMWDAIEEGLLARRSMEKVEKLEAQLRMARTVMSVEAFNKCRRMEADEMNK